MLRPVVIAMVTGLLITSTASAMEWFDALVARVNGVPILVSEVSANELLFHGGTPFEELAAPQQNEAVSRLIKRRLLLAEAERFGVTRPGSEAIETAFDKARARLGDRVWWIDQETMRDQVQQQLWMEAFINARIRAFIMIRDDMVTAEIAKMGALEAPGTGAQIRSRVRERLTKDEEEIRLGRFLTRLLNREKIKRYPLPTP